MSSRTIFRLLCKFLLFTIFMMEWGFPAGAVPDGEADPQNTQNRKIDPLTGMREFDYKYLRFSVGIDYIVLGGQVEEGFTPTLASSIRSHFKFSGIPGRFMLRVRPEAFLSVNQARSEVKSSYSFTQLYMQGARAILARTLGIPIDMVDKLVPAPVIAKTEALVKAGAEKVVDERIDYNAAAKTALDGITYSLNLSPKLGFSIGKDFPNQEYDFLPTANSLIFGSVPNATLSYQGGTFAPALRVYHDRPSIESPFGVANAYVRAVMRDGVQFFDIQPDSVEAALRVQDSALGKKGLGGIKSLMFGAGSRDGDPYGFLRADFESNRLYMRNLVSWQGTQEGIVTRYSAYGTCRVASRLALGAMYYLHTGDADSFYSLQPLLDVTIRRRPWVGWLGNTETHFVVRRGYSQGSLVKTLTGESEVFKDWNFEIQMVRNPR